LSVWLLLKLHVPTSHDTQDSSTLVSQTIVS